MKIYLASPFFNQVERENVVALATYLRNQGHEVYVPMEHEVENAWNLPNAIWAQKVFLEDMKAIKNCDEVYAISNYGMSDDAGTCWEIGFAFGINKRVNLVAGSFSKVKSLMILNGCTKVYSLKWFRTYNELEEIELGTNLMIKQG